MRLANPDEKALVRIAEALIHSLFAYMPITMTQFMFSACRRWLGCLAFPIHPFSSLHQFSCLLADRDESCEPLLQQYSTMASLDYRAAHESIFNLLLLLRGLLL